MYSYNHNMITRIVILLVLFSKSGESNTFCELPFEGFGVFLGSVSHFSWSAPGTIAKVLDLVYHDLGIRLYRTSYEPEFSKIPGEYEIKCNDNKTCHWDEVHRVISKYDNISVFASVWIAPYYLMDMKSYELPVENELQYLYYIQNITRIIKEQYGITIEKISPINEPENVFASWDHTNMSPTQLCRMIHDFQDPVISLCPENSYFWVSDWYKDFVVNSVDCKTVCDIQVTHAYAPNLDTTSPDFPLAYYDLTEYSERGTTKPIWMTEVSSTWSHADKNQMKEALDLSTNIVHMVGSTCIQRYYFWYAYTSFYSGESLIWGGDDGLQLPKKYFAYKHFTSASTNVSTPFHVRRCDEWATAKGVLCLSFGDKNAVFVNGRDGLKPYIEMKGSKCSTLCCTTATQDYFCSEEMNWIPEDSVCSCYNILPDLRYEGSNAGQKQFISELIVLGLLYLVIV